MNCVKCGVALAKGAVFCSNCGKKQPEMVASPEQIRTYRDALASFMDDGVLEDWEQTELRRLRDELRISDKLHDDLMKEFESRQAVPLELFVDAASMESFQQDRRCLLRLRLLNPSDRPLKGVGIRYITSATDGVMAHDTAVVPPRKYADFSVGLEPSIAGQHTWQGVLSSASMSGKTTHYEMKAIAFTVKARQEGPQSVSVNIDASSMKVGSFDDWNLTGADTENRAGLMPDGNWLRVKLKSIPPERANDWVEQKADCKAVMSAADRKIEEEAEAERRRLALEEQVHASSSEVDKGRLDLDSRKHETTAEMDKARLELEAQRQAHDLEIEKRRLENEERERRYQREREEQKEANSVGAMAQSLLKTHPMVGMMMGDTATKHIPDDVEELKRDFLKAKQEFEGMPWAMRLSQGGSKISRMKALVDGYRLNHSADDDFERLNAYFVDALNEVDRIKQQQFKVLIYIGIGYAVLSVLILASS